jgi:GDPmannose 4,6-dehydratase
MSQRVLISGVSGQDGSFLAEFLLAKGWQVYGLVRRDPETIENLRGILDKVTFLYGDMRDAASLSAAIHKSYPDEIYNLAAQSFVPPSWNYPAETLDINAGGLARLLHIVLEVKPDIKVYQASSSEMFGNQEGLLDESTPLLPTSPYGISKLAAHHLVQVYKQKGVHCISGILMNHESERRGQEMVTMKICHHVARFAKGIREPLQLGNLQARRDWGYAPDFVEAIWLMMREAKTDYVVGTGESHSVEECLDTALEAAGLDVAEFKSSWLQSNSRLYRPSEIHVLRANAAKVRQELGWAPKTSFREMIAKMVNSEMKKLEA